MDKNFATQPIPYWYYKRFKIPRNSVGAKIGEVFLAEIPSGFSFCAKNFYACFDGSKGDQIQISFSDIASGGRHIIGQPADVALLSTPSALSAPVAVPNPYVGIDGTAYPVEFNADKSVSSSKHIGYIEPYAGTMRIKANLKGVKSETNDFIYCDFVMFGELLPESSLEFWGGNNG